MNYVSSNLEGGLGNYLFQISAGYALSLRDNKKYICFLNDVKRGHTHISKYFDNIFRNINFTEFKFNSINYNELNFHYNEIPFFNENINLIGYFQSENYFINYSKEIRNLFSIDSKTYEILNQKYSNIINSEKTCSLHVRRGDYLYFPNHHPTLNVEYYKEASKHFPSDFLYVIFSDDINWCKSNLDFLNNKIFIEDNLDYQDMYLMSMCKNNIIANSSFSWWGAWMNKNENKKVIAPKNWFGAFLLNTHDTKDLYCKDWILI